MSRLVAESHFSVCSTRTKRPAASRTGTRSLDNATAAIIPPPAFPEGTLIACRLKERADAKPEERDEWAQVRQYFPNAWPSVLANLQRRFDPNSAAP